MRKKAKTIHTLHPHLPHTQPPLPLHLTLRLPAAVIHLTHRGSSALVAERVGILQWKPSPLARGKGNRFPDAGPTATRLRNRGSYERQLALHVSSAEGARSPVGNHPQTAWIGPASELLSPFCFCFSGFYFRKSDSFLSFFSQCKVRGMKCEYPTESRRGTHRTARDKRTP